MNRMLKTDELELLDYMTTESKFIMYRPLTPQVTGSITSAILFQYLCTLWKWSGNGVFYKFYEPCGHSWYKAGDSIQEETGFSRKNFNTAFKKIGVEAKSVDEIDVLLNDTNVKHCFVKYYDTPNKITWYYVNKNKVLKLIAKVKKLIVTEETRLIEAKREKRLDPKTKASKDSIYEQPESEVYDGETETEIPLDESVNVYNPENNDSYNYYPQNENQKEEKTPFDVVEGKIVSAKEPEQSKKPSNRRLPGGSATNGSSEVRNFETMPIDFEINRDIIMVAVEMGYDFADVVDEAGKYTNYYKNTEKGSKRKHNNWHDNFIYGWLDNSYKRGYLKRNGRFYKLSANDERLEKLREHSKPLFDHITD